VPNETTEEVLNLKGIACPANAARATLKLATMDAGEVLCLHLDDGEPMENVPSALEVAGHQILEKTRINADTWVLRVRVGE